MSSSEACPTQKINELYWGFTISRAIHVAAKFGIADYVAQNGTLISEIAKRTLLNEDRLYRLMRLLASYKIFQETDKGIFIATPLSDAISTHQEGSIRDAAHMVTKSMWEAYGHLEHCIKTGEDAYNDLFGKGIFEYLDEKTDEGEQFSKAMHNYAELENPIIADNCDLKNAKSIVDIGGGHGGFLKEILLRNPRANGTLFDQPQIVRDAINMDDTPELHSRFDKVGGDFFKKIPVGADAYFLKRILHDWNDDDCCKILSSIKNSMTSSSTLYIIDAVVPMNNEPHFSKDLEAFLMTWGGQERDAKEFGALLNKAGFVLETITDTSSTLSIIEAKVSH